MVTATNDITGAKILTKPISDKYSEGWDRIFKKPTKAVLVEKEEIKSYTKIIDSFSGNHRFLSNFWPCSVMLDGEEYQSVEHAYVAAKTTDIVLRSIIQDCPTAGKVKQLGRKIKLRADWEEIKLSVMEDLLRQKFSEKTLKQRLLETKGYELIEGNHWNDTFWGVCNGVGSNNLGKLLMKIREESVLK